MCGVFVQLTISCLSKHTTTILNVPKDRFHDGNIDKHILLWHYQISLACCILYVCISF